MLRSHSNARTRQGRGGRSVHSGSAPSNPPGIPGPFQPRGRDSHRPAPSGAEGGRDEGTAPRSPGQVPKHPARSLQEPPAAPGRRRGRAPGCGNSRRTRAPPEFWGTDTETRKCCVELGPARTPRPGNGVRRSIPTQPARIPEFPEQGMAPAEPPGPLTAHTGTRASATSRESPDPVNPWPAPGAAAARRELRVRDAPSAGSAHAGLAVPAEPGPAHAELLGQGLQ
ncbi:uncharacterized protein LOC127464517 [Manacus candei]|uniref:uncharacterized protein LOC127464517 n=1 Tax=Manacus candei TaxID=415023 RepID=UPI002225DA9D|nr:uncharacterized protein LOC127464517 [Manacus candei]